jgi:hypothetical protein
MIMAHQSYRGTGANQNDNREACQPLIVELLEFIVISSCSFFEPFFTSIYDLNTNVNS